MKQREKRKTRILSTPEIRLGIDIGGTFTDLVAQASSGQAWRVKVPTTPAQPAKGALESVKKFIQSSLVDPKKVSIVIHATTLASNALLTGTLPPVALVTTEGFRDVLEIGRQNRPELYNLQVERLPPLVPRRFRFEVRERISHQGSVLTPIDTSQARQVARLVRRLGIRSVAICFLHSYANPRHEQAMARLLRREYPRVLLSISSELLPEFREYERTSTTVVNACLQPLISDYLSQLKKGLEELGIRAPLFVMQSNSGTIISDEACREPARIIESGPVAGAVASRFYGKTGREAVISLDVGGTTSKAGVWSGKHFELSSEYEVGGRIHGVRRLEGSGYPVRFPYVDLVEVGTGGGSIAHVDDAGVLHVGPESAGAVPGPACYGRGGMEPTLTDANLLLGRLNANYLLGGELTIDSQLSKRAYDEHVARPMGLSVIEAAVGALRIALSNIAGALRAASVERGHDPRDMTLVAFGGAGPMYACEVAKELEIRRLVIPPWAGVFSSLGLLLAEPLRDYVRTILVGEDDVDGRVLSGMFEELEGKGRAQLKAEGVAAESMVFNRMLDMRYRGQSYDLSVPIPRSPIDGKLVRQAVREFHRTHRSRYGYMDLERVVELVNIRTSCRGLTSKQRLRITRPHGRVVPGSHRRVFIDGHFIDKCQVYDRSSFGPGFRGRGPCVVEDYDSTLLLTAEAHFRVDSSGCVWVALRS